ncbi:SDR family NAD(P)-dependent oxidoreductase [Nocardioides mangrovicus]|uniref:SDR family NAD(P)-dependent oxidoreductase n=1 Tax=Nocardioides mangrovicus TaxID=2478913 RepID=UPI0018E08DFE|nr:SDR family NAD(P)-dependent oxidoreductase [Nocardioides mangrovicus]
MTGAAGGLGHAFCVGLAEAGATTVVGVDLADQSRVQAAVQTTGAHYVAVRADVTSEADCAALAAQVGQVDIVVNNAGIFPSIPFLETSLEEWRRIHRLNVEGTFLITRALLPGMIEAGYGRVVMVASAVVWLGPPGMVAYTASKGALVAMVRSLATEVGHTGVTVNAMTPGLTRTETALSSAVNEDFPRVVGNQAVPRAEEPEDLVSTLLFLCDEGSGFVTGQAINVDGGFAKH